MRGSEARRGRVKKRRKSLTPLARGSLGASPRDRRRSQLTGDLTHYRPLAGRDASVGSGHRPQTLHQRLTLLSARHPAELPRDGVLLAASGQTLPVPCDLDHEHCLCLGEPGAVAHDRLHAASLALVHHPIGIGHTSQQKGERRQVVRRTRFQRLELVDEPPDRLRLLV